MCTNEPPTADDATTSPAAKSAGSAGRAPRSRWAVIDSIAVAVNTVGMFVAICSFFPAGIVLLLGAASFELIWYASLTFGLLGVLSLLLGSGSVRLPALLSVFLNGLRLVTLLSALTQL